MAVGKREGSDWEAGEPDIDGIVFKEEITYHSGAKEAITSMGVWAGWGLTVGGPLFIMPVTGWWV